MGCVCLASTSALGWQQQTTNDGSTADNARRALENGAYADAERLALAAWAHVRDASPDAGTVADTFEVPVEARLAFGSAVSVSVLEDAQWILAIRERISGGDSLDVAHSLLVVANAHVYRGDFRSARPLIERAVALRQQFLPADDESVADGLDQLAFAFVRLETKADLTRARQLLEQSLSIREARAGEPPAALAGTLEVLALVDRYSGRYASGLATIDRAIAIRSSLNPMHPAACGPGSCEAISVAAGGYPQRQGIVSERADTWRSHTSLQEPDKRRTRPQTWVGGGCVWKSGGRATAAGTRC